MSSDIDDAMPSTGTEIVIRRYGLLPPLDWSVDCEDELKKMDEFWNILVNIHDDYTTKYYKIIESDEKLRSAKVEFELAERSAPNSEDARKAKYRLALVQKTVQRELADSLRSLEYQRRDDVKLARQRSNLWWGNYNAVVRAFEGGRRTAVRSGNRMRHRSNPKNGRFTNQIIGGSIVERIYDGSLSQIHVAHPALGAWEGGTRGDRRRLQRTTLTATIFVRDGERRNLTWPMVMHRPIPPDCIVKEMVVTRRLVADKWEWSANFICSRPATTSTPPADLGTPTGVDLGWRLVPEGLRVATVLRPKAEPEFVILDQKFVDSFRFNDDLKTRLSSSLAEGLRILFARQLDLSEDQARRLLLKFLSRSIKQSRNTSSIITNFENKPSYTIDHDRELLEWRLRHRRLDQWLANHQRKVVARRNNFYQNKAAELTRLSSSIVINNLKLNKISKPQTPTEGQSFFPRRAHYYRIIAATSEFVRCLELQCTKHGVALSRVDLPTPLPCPECGSRLRKTRGDALPQICAACDTTFDQDIVACRSLVKQSARSQIKLLKNKD